MALVNTYSISYSANGGTGAPSATTGQYSGNAGSVYTVYLRTGTPTKENYTFLGWSASIGATSPSYQPGDAYSFTIDGAPYATTLYAVWKINGYNIVYKPGSNGTGSTITDLKKHGESITLRGAIYTRTGYTQTGWSTSDGGSKAYNLSATYTTNAALTLYPYWTANTYTITYKPGSNGTGSQQTATKTYGQALTLKGAIFTRNGYDQTGWATSDGGSKAYNLSGSYTTNAAATFYPYWSAKLSTVTTSNSNVGTAKTLTVTKYGDNFTHTITYQYGNATGTIVTKSSSTSISWTPPASLADEFPNDASATCTLTVRTYDGNTSLGTTTKTFKLSITYTPSATITITQQGNSTATNWGVYVQGYSNAKFDVTASGVHSSTITSVSINGEGVSKTVSTSTLSATGSIFSSFGTKQYTIVVTDSRGKSTTYTRSITVYEYFKPSFVGFNAYRSDSSGTLDEASGEYLTVIATQFKYASCNSNNQLSVTYKYKESTASSYTTISSTPVANTKYTRSASSEKNYVVQAVMTDSFNNSQTLTVYVASIQIALALGLLNDRARFGGVPRQAGLEVDWNAQFDGVVDVVNRRASASLSSAGWYNIIKYNIRSSTSVKFATAQVLNIRIGTTYINTNNSVHEVTMLATYNTNPRFADELSRSNVNLIDKIRYRYDANNVGWIDVHYAASGSNDVWMTFDVGSYNTTQKYWVSQNFTAVDDAPATGSTADTILTTHSFAATTVGDASLTAVSSRGSISSGKAAYFGNSVHLNFTFTASTTLTNSPQIASTVQAAYDSALSCIDITSGIRTAITSSIPCGVATNGGIYIKEITSGHVYAITGTFLL